MPFDCKSTNDNVLALGLWIGNTETAFTEQLAKIKSKRSYWKPRKLSLASLIGRVHVANIFILFRLWYKTEIFAIPLHILPELDSYIIEFVWNGKKHKVSKELLLCATLENGNLGFTKITNKIFAQRIVWLSKLYNMDQNCFTKVIAEEPIENLDTECK